LRLVHPDAQAVTGNTRLCNFEESASNPVAISNADFVVGQALHREVFAELPIGEIRSAELAFPVPVSTELINHHCPLFTAMSAEIPLPIAVNVEPPYNHPARHWLFPNSGVYGAAAPREVPR